MKPYQVIVNMSHHVRNLPLRTAVVFLLLSAGTFAPTARAQSPGEIIIRQLQNQQTAEALGTLGPMIDLGGNWLDQPQNGLVAAGGSLARALNQLSDDERYELLYKWSLPDDARQSVRIFTTYVPRSAPPEVFARVLRERPRETSFAVSSIGDVRGVFCTGWMLVQSANELGRLARLQTELEELKQKNVPNADVLLELARIADRRSDAPQVLQELTELVPKLSAQTPQTDRSMSGVNPSNIALACAALTREELREFSESTLSTLVDLANTSTNYRLRSIMREFHGVAVQLHRGASGVDAIYRHRLKYWDAVSDGSARDSAEGASNPIWLTHEDHILHLSGGNNDLLFFRYPIVGDFDFSCETQEAARVVTDCGLAYGGLQFIAQGRSNLFTILDAGMLHRVDRPCPFLRFGERSEFNRVSVRSQDGAVAFEGNLHPLWKDDDTSAHLSPWIGLRSYGNHRPLFRNLKLTGTPVIPREVQLLGQNELRGWVSRFYGETLPPFVKPAAAPADLAPVQASYSWTVAEGVLFAEKLGELPETARPSLLRYQRPLLDGEQVRYEFLHQPGELEVHPAFGRLAFLIEPAGVRIRWLTDGGLEWTTLPADNATLEPLNRRGPRTVPLKENEWNTVILARSDGKLSLSLNDAVIYERPIDFTGDEQFGLYRDRSLSGVRVRNIVLSGDWPESVPEEFLKDPTTVIDGAASAKDVGSRSFLAGEDALAMNVREVRRRASEMSVAERYEYLSQWILPNEPHEEFRIAGEFVPTDPSPLALKLEPHRFPSERGGEFVSPVFELLDAARELKKLDDLYSRVSAIEVPAGEAQQRARFALLVMIDLERGRSEAVPQLLFQLTKLVTEAFKQPRMTFPAELHLVYRGVHRFAAYDSLGDLLSLLYQQRFYGGIDDTWETHLQSMTGIYIEHLEKQRVKEPLPEFSSSQWIPVVRSTSYSRGDGYPHASWRFDAEHVLHHRTGHHRDYLVFRSPLSGTYGIECDIHPYGTSQLMSGGLFVGPRGGQEELMFGTFLDDGAARKAEFPAKRHERWVHVRGHVADQIRRVLINGGTVLEDSLPPNADPWVGIRSNGYSSGQFWNVAITGTPIVPESIDMLSSRDLSNWLVYYHGQDSAGNEGADWRIVNDTDGQATLLGRANPALANMHCESLLRYHRPLVEDGSIEYDFFYTPESELAHPALDRLAFLLEPDGVRIHWITDARYDRTNVPPDNVAVEPEHRRGPSALPLRAGKWNHLQLSIAGEIVTLELNGQSIYERPLEANNRRTFGLFHYLDRSQVRVRNVVMHGDWPKTVPAVPEQELVRPEVAELERQVAELPAHFSHDFTNHQDLEKYFLLNKITSQGRVAFFEQGLYLGMQGAPAWGSASISPRFSLSGDFDVRVEIEQLSVGNIAKEALAVLEVQLSNDVQHHIRSMAGKVEAHGRILNGQVSALVPTMERRYDGFMIAEGSLSGTLRIARVGETVFVMFAEGDSNAFRVIRTDSLSGADVAIEGIQLRLLANGPGELSVVWKNLSLRAERIQYLPSSLESEQRSLVIMNADGSEVRRITSPLEGYSHLGSPEFSADSETIVFDMSTGGTTSSHIFSIQKDGTGATDLGLGCMPSLSADGKSIVLSDPSAGVVIMNADGTDRQVLDGSGWGVQFSPDGKWIAYGKSGNIVLRDAKTGESNSLFTGADAARFSQVYWNLGWSHDSQSIAFMARLRDGTGYDVAVVDIESPAKVQTLLTAVSGINQDFTFSPDNQQVLFAMQNPQHGGPQLYTVSRQNPGTATLLAGQPQDHKILDCEWSHDGKEIVFASILIPQPVDWPIAENK